MDFWTSDISKKKIHGLHSWILGFLRRRRKRFHGLNSWIFEKNAEKFHGGGPIKAILASNAVKWMLSVNSRSSSILRWLEKKEKRKKLSEIFYFFLPIYMIFCQNTRNLHFFLFTWYASYFLKKNYRVRHTSEMTTKTNNEM